MTAAAPTSTVPTRWSRSAWRRCTARRIEGLPKWQGRHPQVQVIVALSTLLRIDEQPGELAGYGPIPAEVARKMAADPTGTWTRLVTDELGQLVDYGREKYRPPQDLIDHVTARDRTCRGPHCHRHARRCEVDHVIPFSEGGQTNAGNLGPECPREHHVKHDAGWQTERLPDGTIRWTTPTGRVYDRPPETYPIDQTRPKTRTTRPTTKTNHHRFDAALVVPRQQSHRPERLQQQQRVEVLVAAPRTPVQARAGFAVAVCSVHPADHLTPPHLVTAMHRRLYRLVLGAHAIGMQHDDEAAPGNRPGEGDDSGPRGANRRSRCVVARSTPRWPGPNG